MTELFPLLFLSTADKTARVPDFISLETGWSPRFARDAFFKDGPLEAFSVFWKRNPSRRAEVRISFVGLLQVLELID